MNQIFRSVDDVCALIIIVGCFVLVGFGVDGEVKAILGLSAGYIFGKHRNGIAAAVSKVRN